MSADERAAARIEAWLERIRTTDPLTTDQTRTVARLLRAGGEPVREDVVA